MRFKDIFWLPRILLSCDIPFKFWKNTNIGHPVGIVISENAVIGRNVTIYSGVVVGGKYKEGGQEKPTIEDNVIIYANSTIIGNITIGKNAIIGAGSVMLKDVPENELWVGVPAKRIR